MLGRIRAPSGASLSLLRTHAPTSMRWPPGAHCGDGAQRALAAGRGRQQPRKERGAARGGHGKQQQASKSVRLPELCTAERLSRELAMPLQRLLRAAESLGEPIDTPSRPLARELVELVCEELGFEAELVSVDATPRPPPSAAERAKLPLRPPVVTLMGHVDHGKTSLLDAFRGSRLAAAEAGGITQGISAFTVEAGTPHALTFIDTPGHELFSAMRRRGARATDVVVLVVACDAGVQPTTVQAIEYARETGAPLVVAANKIDKPDAERGKARLLTQLMEFGVVPEEMGGEVPVVGVSATKGLNLDELREAVLLQAELLELHEEHEASAEGVVLEAAVHKGMGIVASVLVQRGTLRTQDHLVAGLTWGRVKAMKDEGRAVKLASPSTPVSVSGLRELPSTGDEFLVVPSEARAKEVSEYRRARLLMEESAGRDLASERSHEAERRAAAEAARSLSAAEAAAKEKQRAEWWLRKKERTRSGTLAEDPTAAAADGGVKLVPAIVKADTAGSLEAVHEGISHFPADRVKLRVLKAEVGAVSEADVQLASTLGAAIVGFNVPMPSRVTAAAEKAGVPFHTHKVIYELVDGGHFDIVDGVKTVLEEAIEPIIEEAVLGVADVQQVFTLTLNRKDRREGMSKSTHVAGARVSSGEATLKARVRVTRGEEGPTLHEGRAVTIRHFKEEVKSVRKGQECGIILHGYGEYEPGDRLVFYEMVARRPSLYDAPNEAAKAKRERGVEF